MQKKKVKKTTTTVVTEEIINTNEKTQIVCVLDRSGSMGSIIEDAIGGFNEFIREQKKLEDEATMTVALFDDKYELLFNNIPIPEVPEFTRETWSPRGMTALYDAIGKTINDVKIANSKLDKSDRPDKVLFCIITDGLENRSQEFKSGMIRTMIEECEKEHGWSFVYLAANQDAFNVGSTFGISAGNTYNFMATSDGMSNVSATLNNTSNYYRTNTAQDVTTRSANLMDNFGVVDGDPKVDNLLNGNVSFDGNLVNNDEDKKDEKK